MAKVTISDVAKRSNVDLSTVSRILNRSFNNHSYAAGTIKRVQDAADALGYRPSVAARSLRTGKTMLLGLIVADIGNPFFSELASCLDSFMGEHHYRMVISSTNEDTKRQKEHVAGLVAHGVDGLIVAPCGRDGLSRAIDAHVPLVAIDRPLPESDLPFVGLDNAAAGALLAAKLAACGYRRVCVVVPEAKGDLTLRERLSGLRRALQKSGVVVSWTLKVPSTAALTDEVRMVVANKLAKVRNLPDAVVGMTNVCTIGILKALEDLGISWGKTLGVAGIDDFAAASVVRPAISVVGQPVQKIAEEAFSLLLRRMKKPMGNLEDAIVRVEPVWMGRESLSAQAKIRERV